MLHKIIALILSFCALQSAAQNPQYLLYLKDKGTTLVAEADVLKSLSPAALARHKQRGVPLSVTDLPVNHAYLDALKDKNVQVLLASRWLNMVHVSSSLSKEELMTTFPFIRLVEPFYNNSSGTTLPNPPLQPLPATGFGSTSKQNNILNLSCMHQNGFTGQNVLVVFFDIGFLGVDTVGAYGLARLQNRFIANRNFVDPTKNAFVSHYHGSLVFSTVGAWLPDTFVGVAPGANFAFAVTEINNANDVHQEELNWLVAAEWADSLGADIINSSLSYRAFAPGEGDYTDAQMDGKTAIITNAARMAASKGIIVVNSAGNEGSSKPISICAPCDADSILCVGSVDKDKNYHSMSSIGPTSNGRIKPDVTAMGADAACLSDAGYLTFLSGTSLSAPQIAGLAACLKQANPQRNSWEIMRAIVVSGSQLADPDNYLGYGIPDACRADSLLKTYTGAPESRDLLKQRVKVYPTVASQELIIEMLDPALQTGSMSVYDYSGKLRMSTPFENEARQFLSIEKLSPGLYLLQLELNRNPVLYRFVKN